MDENKEFDLDIIIDELSDSIENVLADYVNDVIEGALSDHMEDALRNILPTVLSESLSEFEFVLTDVTIVRPAQHMKLLSPDKLNLVSCRGGYVHDRTLYIQTRIAFHEPFFTYPTEEEAKEALIKVKNAMGFNLPFFEL